MTWRRWLYILLAVAFTSCMAQPMDQFHRKKYRVRVKARDGTPSVVQRYYAKTWFFRRRQHKVQER